MTSIRNGSEDGCVSRCVTEQTAAEHVNECLTMLRMKTLHLLQAHISCWSAVRQNFHQLASIKHVCLLSERRRQGLLYPFSALEEHLTPQVDQTEFKIFHPSLNDLCRAETLFTPSHKKHIDYSTSAVRMDHVPALKQPEVRFLIQVALILM